MAYVIIFGLQDYAELANYYLDVDSEHTVLGFSVHRNFLPENREFCGLPVFPFEDIQDKFGIDEVSFFAPLSPKKMDRGRQVVYDQIKEKGYKMISYVSSRASAFDNQIGDNCFILEDNTLQPFTTIGDNVVLWSGNHIGHHGRIEDNVTITSHVDTSGHCVVAENAFLGVNSAVREGLTIGKFALIAMGAVLTGDAEPGGVYQGNPARLSGKRSDEIDF